MHYADMIVSSFLSSHQCIYVEIVYAESQEVLTTDLFECIYNDSNRISIFYFI